jgi:hypothetical protein
VLGKHIDTCQVCRRTPPRFAPTNSNSEIGHGTAVPRTIIFGVQGPVPPINYLLEKLDETDCELLELSSDSPGAQNPEWTMNALRVMAGDPDLCLIAEDDRISPLPSDPCIVVRKALLRYVPSTDFPPITLRKLADLLMQTAADHGRAYRKQALVEVPPNLLL